MRTANEVIAEIKRLNELREPLFAELRAAQADCPHSNTEPRSACCCGSGRYWDICLDCAAELNVRYDDDKGC